MPLLPLSLQEREIPLFSYLFPAVQAGKRGEGRFSEAHVCSVMRSCLPIAELVWKLGFSNFEFSRLRNVDYL